MLVARDDLPDAVGDRLTLLGPTIRPPGVEAILWTPGELSAGRQGGTDPLASEAYGVGVVVYGRLPD